MTGKIGQPFANYLNREVVNVRDPADECNAVACISALPRCAPMTSAACHLPTAEDVQSHVLEVLCAHDHIDPRQAKMRQADVIRGGQTCGVLFEVCGPRRLRTYAIWSRTEQRVLFYESAGIRFAETRVIDQTTSDCRV